MAMQFKAVRLWRILAVCLFFLVTIGPAGNTQEEIARDMEFVPIYNLSQEEAILQLYSNLELIGLERDDLVITTLASVPDKIVIQGPRELIDIAKEILRTIDPPPSPPAPPPPELIDNMTIHNLSPGEFAVKLDEIMNNFIGMVKLEPSADNFIVYAKNASGASQITFYTPSMDTITQAFIEQPLGYRGYTIYIRATTNEQGLINSVKEIVQTIDQPVMARSFEVINIYYMQVDEAINSLKAAGYNAVYTSDGTDQSAIDALQSGHGPIIYAAPQVDSTNAELSSRFSDGVSSGIRGNQFTVLSFTDPVATTDINKLIVFGTPSEIASVETYISLIDVPARQVLIEAQIIELNVDDLSDLGLRSISGDDDILSGSVNPVFPGEGGSSNPGGNFFTYDDAGEPQGSFSSALAALILDGRATVRARPKVVTVDGRQAIITIGRQVPVVEETIGADERSNFTISFVPVGITLNIKPRIGRAGEEVQMQVNAVVSNVETLNNVVSELSLMAPELNTREVSTTVRIPNHQSLILGGLISTEMETRTYKVPLLGDLPLIGSLFRRTREIRDRTEIIIVITPHVAEEMEPRDYNDDIPNPYNIADPYLLPPGSSVLDNLDNAIFPGEYLIKQIDVRGINIATGEPDLAVDQIVPYSSNDPVMLTLLQIIRKLSLVDNLRMMSGMELPDDMDAASARYHAEAFLIAYLRHQNNLDIGDIHAGRRLLVPAFPIAGEGFDEPELAWHSINYLSFTRSNPLLTGIAETIRWLDDQPAFEPYDLFTQPPDSDDSE